MNGLLLAVFALICFALSYVSYATFLSKKIFDINPENITPAHEFEDGIDFVPTNKYVLFGHHFASIAGAAPIVGPAIAVIWGWVPAIIWVIVGTIFMGATHDFSALVVSLRHKGKDLGSFTEDLAGKRGRNLFTFIIFVLLLIVIAVFASVIATLLETFPMTVVPVFALMIIAMLMGFMMYKTNIGLPISTVIGIALMIIAIYAGTLYPVTGISKEMWMVALLIYAFLASVLPVWLLLQPRDYLNSYKLYAGIILMYLGLMVTRPEIVAPAYNAAPVGAPPLFPFLFITIACGAISGFHSLVSSGTTVRQLDNEKDAKFIGYGGMLTEGTLSTIAVVACTAGFASVAKWNEHYATWGDSGKGALGGFIAGASYFISSLGIPVDFTKTFVALVIVAFALTTLDSATRLQRFVIDGIGKSYEIKPLQNRYLAGIVAVGTAAVYLFWPGSNFGNVLWPIFGATNQLLAGLALMVVTLYLVKVKKPLWYTGIPMLFMLVTAFIAMLYLARDFYVAKNWLLVGTAIVLIVLDILLMSDAYASYKRLKAIS